MSAKDGANFVRYFFYRGTSRNPELRRQLVSLAYATAREQMLAPSKILIRSSLHRTTSVSGGRHAIDPKGWHITLAFKDKSQELVGIHLTSHGYTDNKDTFVLKEAVCREVKPDDTPRGPIDSEKVVWPSDMELDEYKDSPVAYSHLPDPGVKSS